jgi:hypothetical protein
LAPGYEVLTDIIGGSTLGNSLIPRKVRPTIPKSRITMAKTVARTGLLILTDDKLILISLIIC